MAQQKKTFGIIAVFFIFFVFLIVVLNHLIQGEIGDVAPPAPAASVAVIEKPEPPEVLPTAAVEAKPTGEVTRKTRVERGSDFLENIFYLDGKEIARQKIFSGDRYEQTGIIPDGIVKFSDDYDGTYGEEPYFNNKKHGTVVTYHPGGRLKAETKYKEGKLIANREYYTNGNICFEVDYSNAVNDPNDKEIGIGKLYYIDGVLKYEWNRTKNTVPGFRKSYNIDGTLRSEIYLDANGKSQP